MRSLLLLALVCAVACAAAPPAGDTPANPTLILATTTSTQDSGLLDVLVPLFQAESGYTVQTVAVGTGAALKMAEQGNADVLLVHAPDAELELMAGGFGKDRQLVMHNDFVVVGPPADPAGITGSTSAADAFARIAAAQAPFVSRGDDSGTHKKELRTWAGTGYEPAVARPEWYIESGQGMGATLIIATEKAAYALTDRATFLANRRHLDLDILMEGGPGLLNVYHLITVNPERWPGVNYAGARALADFITRADIQATISAFGVETFGQPLFFPDAGKRDIDLGLE